MHVPILGARYTFLFSIAESKPPGAIIKIGGPELDIS